MPLTAKVVQTLASRGWLSETPPAFRKQLLSGCTVRDFAPDEPIYLKGDAPGGLWALVSGGLAFHAAPSDTGPCFAHFARPVFWFGEGSVLTRRPRAIGVRATRESVLAHLPLVKWDTMANSNPGVWRWIGLLALRNQLLAIGVGEDMMIRDPASRVAAVLLRLAGLRDAPVPPDERPEVDASQEEIARIANLSRSTVTRILVSFSAAGLVDTGYRSVCILDVAGLAELAQI